LSDETTRIIEAGKNTRFGSQGGPDPSAAAAKGNKNRSSVRAASRRIAAMEVAFAMELAGKEKFQKLNMAEAVALAKFKAALAGDTTAMQQVTEDVDGKLVDRKVHAEVTLADLVTGSLEYDDEFRKGDAIDAEYETCTEADSTVEA